jgi:hypothetical protein
MVTAETLEKQYDELVSAACELVQARESSDVKIMKPYDELRAELHVDMMRDDSKKRFELWILFYTGVIHTRVWGETTFLVETHDDYWRLVLFKDEKLYSNDLFNSYMNRVLCSLGMTFNFGTVDSPLSFDEFRKSCELTDNELYDTLLIAKAKIEQMLNSDLVALIDFSNKLNTVIESRAKESCCDYVFGERNY